MKDGRLDLSETKVSGADVGHDFYVPATLLLLYATLHPKTSAPT